jgi:hypothetical protein
MHDFLKQKKYRQNSTKMAVPFTSEQIYIKIQLNLQGKFPKA